MRTIYALLAQYHRWRCRRDWDHADYHETQARYFQRKAVRL